MMSNIEVLKLPNDNNLSKEDLIKKLMEMEQRVLKAEQKLETFELLTLYVNDIINAWPKVTMRTLWTITDKIATLKQIVDDLGK